MIDLDRIVGFEWDSGNSRKSELKHGVTQIEAEEIFFNEPLLFSDDEKHSDHEKRLLALGKTNHHRVLAVIFTLRQNDTLIRVISARDQHRKERSLYEQASKKT
jgi:uncharacterized DUF497 family protein